MTVKIDADMYDAGADIWYSKEFRDTLESHMAYFRTAASTQPVDVDPQKAEVYDGDLFGYLLFIKAEPRHHFAIMRVNNWFSPTEFGPGVEVIYIPNVTEMEQLRQSQKSTGTGTITM